MSGDPVIVGLSGGVDSAVAALCLQRQGYAVEGLFMRNWEDDDAYCTTAQDLQEARRVADVLGIPLHVADFSREYRDRVFRHFLSELECGRTPNPDVLCNSEIKFGAFLEHALRLGAGRISTGHYARLGVGTDGGPYLLRARDEGKDQTYFLHAVPREALARCLFPLGELRKGEVRRMALDAGLPNFDRPDSTGICFVGERPFRAFLSRFLPARPGEIRDLQGRVLGRHMGSLYYTIGQRRGLGIGGLKGDGDGPWYVADKDVTRNILYVVQGAGHPALAAEALEAEDLHWIGEPPATGAELSARTRHRQALQACRITGLASGRLGLRFRSPQRAITPGQYVVLYQDDRCLGGGVIARRSLSEAA